MVGQFAGVLAVAADSSVTGTVMSGPFLVAAAAGWTACIGPALNGVNAPAISTDWNRNARPRTTYV